MNIRSYISGFMLFLGLFMFASLDIYGISDIKMIQFEKQACDEDENPHKRINALNNLLRYKKTSHDSASIYFRIGVLYNDYGNYKYALKNFEKGKALISPSSLKTYLRTCLNISTTAIYIHDYNKGIEEAFEILEKDKPDSLRYMEAYAYGALAIFFSRTQQPQIALKYITMGEDILNSKSPSGSNHEDIREMLSGLKISLYLDLHKFDEAHDLIVSALRNTSNSANIDAHKGNLAYYYYVTNKDQQADSMFRILLDSPADRGLVHYNRGIEFLNYFTFLISRNRMKEARELADTHPREIDVIRGSLMEKTFLTALADLEFSEGDKDNAYSTLRYAMELADSLNKAFNSIEIEGISRDLERRHQKLLDSRQKEIHRGNLILWVSLSTAFILIAVLVVYIVYKRRLRKRHDALVESDMISRDTELSTISLQVDRQAETINSIRKEIADFRQSKSMAMDKVKALIDRMPPGEGDWESFRNNFERANRGFFDKLYRLHPNLTNMEVRLCAFILMNMTSKEIAATTNRSVNTINSTKHSLRKKFKITEPTIAYIRRISAASDADIERMIKESGS